MAMTVVLWYGSPGPRADHEGIRTQEKLQTPQGQLNNACGELLEKMCISLFKKQFSVATAPITKLSSANSDTEIGNSYECVNIASLQLLQSPVMYRQHRSFHISDGLTACVVLKLLAPFLWLRRMHMP